MDKLPEECVIQVLSGTSPMDACRSSPASSIVRIAAESNVLWEKFLPSDYEEIVSRLVFPIDFISKKDLFIKLSSPCLVDGGRKIFSIDKFTNKKCYMLSARELYIAWSNNPYYWCWKPLHGSRFPEVVELLTICWLKILGRMSTKMLSPNTTYGAYLVVKFSKRTYRLDTLPSEVLVEVGDYHSCGIIYLCQNDSIPHECNNNTNRIDTLRSTMTEGKERKIRKRRDGWIEIELGEFYCDGSEKEVRMELREIKGVHLKGGLVVEGIEVRPK